jgi:hypothetical protein
MAQLEDLVLLMGHQGHPILLDLLLTLTSHLMANIPGSKDLEDILDQLVGKAVLDLLVAEALQEIEDHLGLLDQKGLEDLLGMVVMAMGMGIIIIEMIDLTWT